MVAAGIIYHKPHNNGDKPLPPPDRLNADKTLIQNMHIQGSNLFVNIRKILEAGGFDESMTSTTDRDICIRLADIRTIQYRALPKYLVHHYADNDRPRLSTPGSNAKIAGLEYFYRKYMGRMSKSQKSEFIKNSQKRFRHAPTGNIPTPTYPERTPHNNVTNDTLNLVVGIITSPDVNHISRLMESIAGTIHGRNDSNLKVVLLENGNHDTASRNALQNIIHQTTHIGMDITLITLEQQAADISSGTFTYDTQVPSKRKSIALSRTILQHYLFLEAKSHPDTVVWILDDDTILEGMQHKTAKRTSFKPDYISAIKSLKDTRIPVALCQVTGDPPLPFLSCIRTHLVDLYHNLYRLANLKPDEPFPNLTGENALSRSQHNDYYYDLSSTDTGHLELPFWYETNSNTISASQVFEEITSHIHHILYGIQVFRPIIHVESHDSAHNMMPSTNRGPATLVFDIQALREFPNAIPSVDGIDMRRSDTVWCLLNYFVAGRKIVQSSIPVRQVRSTYADINLDFDTIQQDIRGHAFYMSLRDMLAKKSAKRTVR